VVKEMGDKPHLRVFVHLSDGEMIPLHASNKLTVGEVKQALCADHGYEPDQNGLTYKGAALDDTRTLADCRIKGNSTLKMVFTMVFERRESLEELPSDDEEAPKPKAVFSGSSNQKNGDAGEVVTTQGGASQKDALSREATGLSLKEALSSAALHVQDQPSPCRRREARQVAQERATSLQQEREKKKAEQANVVSVICDVALALFPELFGGCTVSPAEQGSVVLAQ